MAVFNRSPPSEWGKSRQKRLYTKHTRLKNHLVPSPQCSLHPRPLIGPRMLLLLAPTSNHICDGTARFVHLTVVMCQSYTMLLRTYQQLPGLGFLVLIFVWIFQNQTTDKLEHRHRFCAVYSRASISQRSIFSGTG